MENPPWCWQVIKSNLNTTWTSNKLDARYMREKGKLSKRQPGKSSPSLEVCSLHAVDTLSSRGSMSLPDANGSPSTQGTCLVYLLSTVAGEILRQCIHFAFVNVLKYLELRKFYLNSKKLPSFLRKRNGIESKI